jgi:hypothetical protein
MRNHLHNPQHGHLCCSNVQRRTTHHPLRCSGDPMGRSGIQRRATPLRSLHRLRPQGRDHSASRWVGENIGFMPFPLSRYDAAPPIEPLPRDHARHPCFAEAISRRRIKPADAVELVAAVLNQKTLVHLSPSVPEIVYPWQDSDSVAIQGKQTYR